MTMTTNCGRTMMTSSDASLGLHLKRPSLIEEAFSFTLEYGSLLPQFPAASCRIPNLCLTAKLIQQYARCHCEIQ